MAIIYDRPFNDEHADQLQRELYTLESEQRMLAAQARERLIVASGTIGDESLLGDMPHRLHDRNAQALRAAINLIAGLRESYHRSLKDG